MSHSAQGRLLQWAALFLFLQSSILTLSPAVRERSWNVDYRLSHWVGFFAWAALTYLIHRLLTKTLPERDVYIFPAASLLTGWGLLAIWRLDESFGLKQTAWLLISSLTLIILLRLRKDLSFLRNYKYIFLSAGLLITALTLIFGTNPLGIGPRLWLNLGGVYFQPSEPLKVLLVIYLSAYLADRASIRLSSIPLLVPTVVVTGLALLLLVVQRDLGTASIFIMIFTVFLFIATGKRRILIGTGSFLLAALLIGYYFVDIIHARVVGWLNPWGDPTGNSYQIIQSLLAVANGGILGRGLGIGSPLLVPVSISDFIFAAISEEAGLAGTLGLVCLIWLILSRGLIIALRAPDQFRRYLAAGITAYLGIQSLLIIGGNLRLLPLTGVTLPFVSYGGSSLLTSFLALYLLLTTSHVEDDEPAPIKESRSISTLSGIFAVGFAACAIGGAWWAIVRGDDLLARTDNARRAIADRYVLRGELVDSANTPLHVTTGESGSYIRKYLYPDLAPIIGYTHPVYGQAGLEASLDEYLRGLQGNPSSLILTNQLVYGTPPPGLDVRLSLDLSLQTRADELLGTHTGAIILMNAETGEILVMASHPAFDPNLLDEQGNALSQDKNSPLLNRATQGLYPLGGAMLPVIQAAFDGDIPSDAAMLSFLGEAGLLDAPLIAMPVAKREMTNEIEDLRASPLQVCLAAAAVSYQGVLPAPRIATAVNTREQGWVVLPALTEARELIQPKAAAEAALSLLKENGTFWSHSARGRINKTTVTWFIAGTPPDWQGAPLVLVVALEEDNPKFAETLGERLLNAALGR
ncbi:MAG: FtsW/RodA/SpoVE family cell cycle protein [Anaerolineales bacterium]|jgi:cell division protein FtsW (lipid II flippase)|nr:FtsW/RodA/SpoVE family cell cycle protein [Anaerolineales bacterium]